MQENCKVIQANAKKAVVQLNKSAACEGCGKCVFGKKNYMTLSVDNDLGAHVGDEVLMSMPEPRSNLALLVLALPIAFALIGLFVASLLTLLWQQVLTFCVLLALGFLAVYLLNFIYVKKNPDCKPKMLQILDKNTK